MTPTCGAIVREIRTDRRGRFTLAGLPPGTYWVTFLDATLGESFFVEIAPSPRAKPFDLRLRAWHGMCYLVDIERNVTIPVWGKTRPVYEEDGSKP